MEGLDQIKATLELFGVGNYAVMLGIAVLAFALRRSPTVPWRVAVWFPTLLGGVIGGLVAIVAVEGQDLSAAALVLAVLMGFITHGAAATLVARLGFALLQKIVPEDSPPASETKDGGAP